MSDASTRALARLRDPNDPAATELAGLVAQQLRDVALSDLVPARRVAEVWAGGWRALASDDRLGPWLTEWIEALLSTAEQDRSTLREQIPVGGTEIAEALLRQPFTPGEDLLFRLVNQPALRGLVGYVLDDAVRAIGRRLGTGSPGDSRLRGLLRSVKDNLGDVASSIVDVVRDEVDGVLDGRMTQAVQAVTERAVRTLAAYVADESHDAAFAEMRGALVGELLDTPIPELAAEGRAFDVDRAVADVVSAVRGVAGRDDLVARIHADLERGLDLASGRTLGQELDVLGLDETWRALGTTLAEPAIRSLVASDDFEAFWQRLHA
ncbi:MAG: hypothetical protein AAF602_03830 [Myxococcota bacterium]